MKVVFPASRISDMKPTTPNHGNAATNHQILYQTQTRCTEISFENFKQRDITTVDSYPKNNITEVDVLLWNFKPRYIRINTLGDGNCLFHAVRQAANIEDDIQIIRKKAVKYVDEMLKRRTPGSKVFNSNKEQVLELNNKQLTIPEFKKAMRRSGEFGNYDILECIAIAYNLTIGLFMYYPSPAGSLNYIEVNQITEMNFEPSGYIVYTNSNHYDAVFPIQ